MGEAQYCAATRRGLIRDLVYEESRSEDPIDTERSVDQRWRRCRRKLRPFRRRTPHRCCGSRTREPPVSRDMLRVVAAARRAAHLGAVGTPPRGRMALRPMSTKLHGVSRLTAEMPASGIREVMGAAEARVARGLPDVLHLEVGQPDCAAAPHIVDAAVEALADASNHGYCHNAGLRRLRSAVARRIEATTGVATSSEEIVVTTGAVTALTTVVATLAERGDEVLVPNPCWPNYEMSVAAAGATVVRYNCPRERQWLPDVDEVESLITPATRAIMACSPSNPTGRVLPAEVQRGLIDVARRHGIHYIADEIYEQITFDGITTPSSLAIARELGPDAVDSVVYVSGFSKAYAMCGFRVGYLRARAELIPYITKLQEVVTSCGVPASQLAAVAALEGPQDAVAASVARYQRRRDIALSVLRENGLYEYTPEGAFYLLVPCQGRNSKEFAFDLLENHGVAVAPGETFGSNTSEHLRVAFSNTDDNIREGLTRICKAINAS